MTHPEMMLESVFHSCEQMIRKGSSSFYHAFSGLPSPRKEAVYVIYAFCRMIDDSVDEPERSPYSIYELREHFMQLDRAEGHFIWPALRWLFVTFPQLDQQPFLSQMDGQLRDLSVTHYDSMEQLEDYCYLVAGTVGEMLLPVLREDRSEAAVEAGIRLGKAMQIVNIMRDVGEDRDRGRRYIPLELMQKHGYSEAAWLRGEISSDFKAMLGELKEIALNWFQEGLADVESYPPASGMAVELAATFYASILNAIEDNDYDVYTKRAFVSDEDKHMMFGLILAQYDAHVMEAASTAVS